MSDIKTTEEIQEWFSHKISKELEVPFAEVDPHANLADFGIDSITMVEFAGDLNKYAGISIEPGVLYRYTTIAEIAAFAHQQAREAVHGK